MSNETSAKDSPSPATRPKIWCRVTLYGSFVEALVFEAIASKTIEQVWAYLEIKYPETGDGIELSFGTGLPYVETLMKEARGLNGVLRLWKDRNR